MLYGRETWCVRKDDKMYMRRTEKAMLGVNLIEKKEKLTDKFAEFLRNFGQNIAKANGVR